MSYARKLLSGVTDEIDISDNRCVYLVSELPSRSELLAASMWIPGTFYVSKLYVVHAAGRYSEVYIKESAWPELQVIRSVTQDLLEDENVGFTPTQCARSVEKWLRIRQAPLKNPRIILPDFAFYQATPARLEYGYMHDMSGAYWTIAKLIPSPLIVFYQGHPIYERLTSTQRQRWDSMLDAFQPHKLARLAIIGNWVSGYVGTPSGKHSTHLCIRDGEYHPIPLLPPKLNPFGLLVVRSVYEICQEEWIQSNAVYAYVDCVISEQKDTKYWDFLRLPHKIKAEGQTHIANIQARKIGREETEAYTMHISTMGALERRGLKAPRSTSWEKPHHGKLIDPQLYLHKGFMK